VKSVSGAVTLAVTATVAAGIVLLLAPGHAALVGHTLLVVLLALSLAVALDRLQRAVPTQSSGFDAAFAPEAATRARPASLARVEREVSLATGTAFDVHYRLRPTVRSVANGLLLRRGIDLERRPDRARPLLGADVWELVRPDRPAPDDRTARGLELDAIERAVDSLERLRCS
jgi:hypothetical protein